MLFDAVSTSDGKAVTRHDLWPVSDSLPLPRTRTRHVTLIFQVFFSVSLGELGEDCGEAGDGYLAETVCGWWPVL